MVKVVGAPGANGGNTANGGDGGAAVADDPESGAAGVITASATAKGGAGGSAGNGFTPGVGGPAAATANAANTNTTGVSDSYAYAAGGAGGEAFQGGKSMTAVPGGAAAATSTATALGAATAKATTVGGVGGIKASEGNGGDGGGATTTATAVGATANAVATATGGAGGPAISNRYFWDGKGGQATASATAIGVTWASAKVHIVGGSGGIGASEAVTNAVAGSTEGGTLYLTQEVAGGAGISENQKSPPAAGSASSSLTFDDTQNATRSAKVKAIVEAISGGGGYTGGTTAYLNLTGAALVASSQATTAGERGSFLIKNGFGAATATTIANSTSVVSAAATASAEQSAAAKATTTATGLSGALQASASSVGLAVLDAYKAATTLSAATGGKVSGESQDQALAGFGLTSGFNDTSQGVAFIVGEPGAAAASQSIGANMKIAAAFGFQPHYFNLGELGGRHSSAATGTQTVTSSIDESLVLGATLNGATNLIVGLYGGELVGNGVTGVSFSIYENGTEVVQRKFSNLANAKTFFTDNPLNLGSLAPEFGQALDLKMVLTVTSTTANSGFYANMVVGGGPAQPAWDASVAPLTQAMASFGAASSTSVAGAAVSHPAPKLLLAATRHAIA